MTDYDVEREDQVTGIALLLDVGVDTSFHWNACPRIDRVGHDGAHGTERVESFSSGPLAVFILQVASGDIVHAGVPENVLPNVGICGRLVTGLADYYPKFAFIVHAL